jgi:hypothetical protein
MSHVGQFRQYAEERDSPRRRVSNAWKYSPPARASEYHLINLATGISHGGFETLAGARQSAVRKVYRPGTSSMGMFGSSTTTRVTTSPSGTAPSKSAARCLRGKPARDRERSLHENVTRNNPEHQGRS